MSGTDFRSGTNPKGDSSNLRVNSVYRVGMGSVVSFANVAGKIH